MFAPVAPENATQGHRRALRYTFSHSAGADLAAFLPAPDPGRAARAGQLRAELEQVTQQTRNLIRLQASAPPALSSLYDDELRALAARLNGLQRELARADAAAPRAMPEQAVAVLRAETAAKFWAKPERDQNAFLHTLFGPLRLAVNTTHATGFYMPPAS